MIQKRGDYNVAVENAIIDFLGCKLSQDHNVFFVRFEDIREDIISFTISSSDYKIYITPIDTIGSTRLPIKYIVKEKKLFYWYDSDYSLTKETINALSQFNVFDFVDHTDLVALLGGYIDEKAKGAHYYFCKNDLANYKRIMTNRAMGLYNPPKLKCKRTSYK